MKTWKKVLLGAGAALVLLIVVGVSVYRSRKDIVTVQTGRVTRQDISSVVTASGEIKPKTFVNVGANAFGKITHLYVKEGAHVKRGQLLAQLENVQSAADVAATRASLGASETDFVASGAASKTAAADEKRAQSDLNRAQLDWDRAQGMFKDQLISKADYDIKKAAWETAAAGLEQAKARVAQAKAQQDSADKRIAQTRANLTRASDVLQKTTYAAPFDGIVTNLPVREGESVVIGIQNSPGSTLMTVADMSVITAEVRVDETDIVNVRLGQPAEVTIDAFPRQVFKATVTEIGDNALVRSTGVATSQTNGSSQEAKDFKVTVTLTNPPDNLRPGLSTTAKITTATSSKALTIPIQALTVRDPSDLVDDKDKATSTTASTAKDKKNELQGVFVIRDKKSKFVQVETGIAGATDIEVKGGLQEGEEIVTGSFKILRTLRQGVSVKVDNAAPKKEDEAS
jgi:HlyD family secretion protein